MALGKTDRYWLGYRVEVNDLLPDVGALFDALDDAGIPLADTFGSSSDPPDVPEMHILSIGPGIDAEHLANVLRVVCPKWVRYLHAGDDGADRKRFFVGSYVYLYEQVTFLNERLLDAVLSKEIPDDELAPFIKRAARPHSLPET